MMTLCSRFSPEQLAAFNDNELGAFAAWRVRRHVTQCGVCAQEIAGHKALNTLLVSADVVPKTQRSIVLPKDARSVPIYRRRVIVSSLLGAGIVSAAIGGIAFLEAGSLGSPTIAFADVERSMAEVKTASWRKTRIDYDDATGKERRRTVVHQKLRMFPTGYASRTVYSFAADSPDGVGYTGRAISDAVSVLSYVPEIKEAVFRTRGNGKIRKTGSEEYALPQILNAPKQEQLWRKITLKYIFIPPTAYQGNNEVWVLENTWLDGQPVVLFKRRVQSGRPKAPYVTNTISSIWVDPKTRRVIQNETRETMAETGKLQMLVREEDFRYNIPLKDSDFSLEIPSDVPIVTRPYSEGLKE